MRAGRMDRRITLLRKDTVLSDSGDPVITWTSIATVWAQKIEERGAERFAQVQVVGHAVKTFKIRWSDDVSEVNDTYRVRFDGRDHDITDVREIGRREGIEIDCFARGEEPVTA